MTMTLDQFVPFAPEIFLSVAGFAVLLAGVPLGRRGVRPLALAGLAAMAVAGALVWLFARPLDGPQLILGDMLVVDELAVFFKLLVLAAGAVALLMAAGFLERSGYGGGEYVSLVLFATVGMFVMASGANLVSLYVGLELMALSVYVLVGYFKLEIKSNEAAVKYFVLGAASSAVLLYGFSLIYGALGTLDLAAIRASLVAVPTANPMLMLGMVLVGFGMLFKVAAVPFHVWTPDAYEGAPTPVTAFISVAPKAAAFAMFIRLYIGAFEPGVEHWRAVLWVAAAATMIFGNIAALTQDNVKRMLAYSSIAHGGYALMGLVAATAMGSWALLLYMLVYAFMNLGAFGFVILLESKGYAGEVIGDYAGLARRHPSAALGMLIFMLALAGIPPTAGFMGKLYLFAAAVEAGYVVLTVIAVIMSAVSLYYYFRIVVQMYLRDGDESDAAPAELLRDRWTELMIGVCVAVTLVVGIYPAPVVGWAKSAAGALGMI
jgi:NADH-quinone oxidoreductase subunit N